MIPSPPAYAADLTAIEEARARICPHLAPTPLLRSRGLDAIAGRELFFKAEPFQKGGSFKIRGALNAVLSLSEAAAARGVVTHSSGNFAAAMAIAAGMRGIPAFVVMPEDAPAVKVAAVRGYGGEVIPCHRSQRAATAEQVRARTGAALLHPYDQDEVIAGQGTLLLELREQAPALDAVIAPVGGGGLVSGIALAAREALPGLPVYGAEPQGADDAARGKALGRRLPQDDPRTLADGLRTALGERTWPVLRDLVPAVVTVSEEEIVAAMRLLWERLKVVVEPSGAVAFAGALKLPAAHRRVGVVLSGGNVDLDELPFARPRGGAPAGGHPGG